MNARPIATVTGRLHRHRAHSWALCSPTEKRPNLIRGKQLTIIDCHTFYWRRCYRGPDRLKLAADHYVWFCGFVEQLSLHGGVGEQSFRWRNGEPFGTALVSIDFDWLRESSTPTGKRQWERVAEVWWKSTARSAPTLAMPGETSFAQAQNLVGHCLRPDVSGPVHPDWTHTFSVPEVTLNGPTRLWTYDSSSVRSTT